MQNTNIEWCDHSFNAWTGCSKSSPACKFCYAEMWAKRAGRDFNVRVRSKTWKDPLKWNRKAEQDQGASDFRRPRVFSNSLSDWLDDEVPVEWLVDLLNLIDSTQNLDWLLLTKRPQNWKRRIMDALAKAPEGSLRIAYEWVGCNNPPKNVWIGTTVENQEMAERRIPMLLSIPAKIRFLSCEPLLGPLKIDHIRIGDNQWFPLQHIHWVIAGGESGGNARPMHPDWVRSLRDQCRAADISFLFKQWGEWVSVDQIRYLEDSAPLTQKYKGHKHSDGCLMLRVGKKSTGRILDGSIHHDFPHIVQSSI